VLEAVENISKEIRGYCENVNYTGWNIMEK
jgi:hypothetical protein